MREGTQKVWLLLVSRVGMTEGQPQWCYLLPGHPKTKSALSFWTRDTGILLYLASVATLLGCVQQGLRAEPLGLNLGSLAIYWCEGPRWGKMTSYITVEPPIWSLYIPT